MAGARQKHATQSTLWHSQTYMVIWLQVKPDSGAVFGNVPTRLVAKFNALTTHGTPLRPSRMYIYGYTARRRYVATME